MVNREKQNLHFKLVHLDCKFWREENKCFKQSGCHTGRMIRLVGASRSLAIRAVNLRFCLI